MRTKAFRSFNSLLVLAAFIVNCTLVFGEGNKFIDPDKFADWEVVGPNGGDVRAVAIDPKDKDRIYASTFDGQIHVSADGGSSWRLLANLNQPQLVLDQLLVDSRDSRIIYTSGHRGKRPGGFFRSTDFGATWKEAKELKNEPIHAMTQAADDPDMIFVGSETGVWVSKNSGEDWTKISSSSMPTGVNSLEIDPKNNSTIYAGTNWRPYKSTDSGKNWRLIKAGMIDDSDVFAITVNSNNRNHIFASACSGIYESLNGGEQWKKIQGIPSTSRRTRALIQHPSIPGTVYAGTTQGFWMSTNGGKNWSMTTNRNLEINSIAVHPAAPSKVFIGTNNYGVMVSNDGGKSFVPSNTNLTSRLTYAVVTDATQPGRLYATTQNTATSGGFVFYSADSGRTWTPSKGIDPSRISPFTILQDRIKPEVLYLGTNLGVYWSIDRGVSWAPVFVPKPPVKAPVKKPIKKQAATAAKGKQAVAKAAPPKPVVDPVASSGTVPAITEKVKVLAFTEDGKNGILAGTDNGLYRSYDPSKGWERLPFGNDLNANVFVVHASPLVPATIWVGTATSGVIVSRDDGKTWNRLENLPDTAPISSIASDPKRPNYLYVGTMQTLFLSRDGGRTWNRKGGGLPYGDFSSIIINPNDTDEIYAASSLELDGGLYYSNDAGNKWKRLDGKGLKIPSRRVRSISFDPNNVNRLYASSHSSGVYVIDRHEESAHSTK